MDNLTYIKDNKVSPNGQVVLPAFFRRSHLITDNKVSIYLTKINNVESIVLIPTSKIKNQEISGQT